MTLRQKIASGIKTSQPATAIRSQAKASGEKLSHALEGAFDVGADAAGDGGCGWLLQVSLKAGGMRGWVPSVSQACCPQLHDARLAVRGLAPLCLGLRKFCSWNFLKKFSLLVSALKFF